MMANMTNRQRVDSIKLHIVKLRVELSATNNKIRK